MYVKSYKIKYFYKLNSNYNYTLFVISNNLCHFINYNTGFLNKKKNHVFLLINFNLNLLSTIIYILYFINYKSTF